MALRIAIPDMISPSYFPAIAAVELGLFEREGIDATIELVFPVTRAFAELRDGTCDLVAGAAHAALYAFPDWNGCRLLCALSQHTYWFLVVSGDTPGQRGEVHAIRGLRIGAAPGPADALRQLLREAGLDPDTDVRIQPIPNIVGGASFGVAAAAALKEGLIDGFWANGMAADIALRDGGKLLIDARRGDGPARARHYTFPALVAAQRDLQERQEIVAAAVAAVTAAQRSLKTDPGLAIKAAGLFPAKEQALMVDLIRHDAPYYSPRISLESVEALNDFGRSIGLLSAGPIRYDQVVAVSPNGVPFPDLHTKMIDSSW